MNKRVRFFKQEDRWYADVPNHSLEDNEMVMGADIALDLISEGHDEVFLILSDIEDPKALLHFHIKEHDDEGAYYTVSGLLYNRVASLLVDLYPQYDHEIWICNVTHDVFGEHPNDIYLIGIEK